MNRNGLAWALISILVVCSLDVAAQQHPGQINTDSVTASPAPKHLHDVKPGMKQESVVSGLSPDHRLDKGWEAGQVTDWSVTGLGVYANDTNEFGEITFQNGIVISVSQWLTQGFSGEGVEFAQALFKNLYFHVEPSKDEMANRLGLRQTTATLEVAQLNPLIDEQRISITLEDGTRFNIIIGNYEKSGVPRFAHIERVLATRFLEPSK